MSKLKALASKRLIPPLKKSGRNFRSFIYHMIERKMIMLIAHKIFAGALLSLSVFLLASHSVQAVAETCIWEGKAPACNGECKPGYTLTKRDKEGDGNKCVTGTKAYCCKTSDVIIRGTAPFCNGKCKEGEEALGDSDYGPNGKKCTTGKAAICRLPIK